jgi:hypothetical protein
MATEQTAALASIRASIINTGSAFLRNVTWTPDTLCPECAGVPGLGYRLCVACNGYRGSVGLVDRLGFIAYAWPGHQSGRVMYGYKADAPAPANRLLVSSLVTYGIVKHWACISTPAGPPDAWGVVPSLRGRPGVHPLTAITSPILHRFSEVPIAAADHPGSPRGFLPENFVVPPTGAKHVLLVDDTWTSGGHVQSVSAALKLAGVERVSALIVARWLDPSWSNTQELISGLREDFDPDICPLTGGPC